MPVQFHSGVGGHLVSGVTSFSVLDWSFTTTNRVAEVTNAGSGGYAEFIATVVEGSGTANCLWDSTNIPDVGTAGLLDPTRIGGTDLVVLKLYVGNSSKFYTFSAVI